MESLNNQHVILDSWLEISLAKSAMPPRRLIRRQPLLKRLKAYLDPLDFLFWLSEELDSSDWEQWQKEWATPIGIGLNIVMLVARANSGASARRRGDDIFGDVDNSAGWMTWFVRLFVISGRTSD